jgi:hypothetical protein
MRLLVDLSILFSAVGGIGWKVMRFWVQKKVARQLPPSPDYEHIKQLERENEEIDAAMERMQRKR